MQKIIYHLHDVCCNHATLTLDDAVKYAIKHGYKELYWTEHSPVSVPCGYQHRRAPYAKLVDLVKRMDAYNKKYKGKFHVYFGYEIEFNKPNRWYFEKLARDPLCQYLILGIHFYGDIFKEPWPYDYCLNDTHKVSQLKQYYEMTKAGMESGLIAWAPHPEIWLNSWCKWDKNAKDLASKLIKLAIKTNTVLGFNVNFKKLDTKSIYHYPCPYFWKMVAKSKAKVIVESDAHDLQKITVPWLNQAHKMAKQFGVEKNIVNKIKINWLPKKPLLLLYEDDLINYVNKDMLKTLTKNGVKTIKVSDKTDLIKVCKQNKVHPVWTLAIIKKTSTLNKVKNTSMFTISNLKGADLSLRKFSKMNYQEFLNKAFIVEIK